MPDEEWMQREVSEEDLTAEMFSLFNRKQGNDRKREHTMRWHINNIAEFLREVTPEGLEMREKYGHNFPLAHREVFTESSGKKPLGPVQIDSANHSYSIITQGGKVMKLEPRGFGKTTRMANEMLLSILLGYRKYALIICASLKKAADIMDMIYGELCGNEVLYEMFPQECEIFRRSEENPQRLKSYHIDGESIYCDVKKDRIIFPYIEGSLCSGSVIQIKPKNNVRGTILRVKEGPLKGRVLRPDLVGMDDLQTDQDAINSKTCKRILSTVKQAILRSGGHSTNMAAIFAATPICPGDVPHQFYFNERSWEVVSYKMLEQLPKNLDWWLTEYKNTLMSFDRSTPGSKIKARLRACELYQQNWDYANEGAIASWEWAYEWDTDPPLELSAVQHAMNILIEEGRDVFDSECQTRLENLEVSTTFSRTPREEIINKQTVRPRNKVAQNARKIVTHVDVQQEFFSFVTVASPDHFEPEIINYGIWPHNNRLRWRKKDLIGFSTKYDGDLDQRLYQAITDFTSILATQEFMREDGVPMYHNLILVDRNWQSETVLRALRDSPHASILKGHLGLGITAKDKPIPDKSYNSACRVHYHCVTIPAPRSRQEALHTDVNFYKNKVHEGFGLRAGLPGSISLFQEEYPNQHTIFADHLWAESPTEDYYEKDKRTKHIWVLTDDDNELFDNIVGCCAGLASLGVAMQKKSKEKQRKVLDMAEYFNSMRD